MTANLAGQYRMGWSARRQVAAKIFAVCPAHIIGFQEFGLDNWETLSPTRPELAFVQGKQAGDIFINPIAFDARRFSMVETGTFWLSPDGAYGKAWGGKERGTTWVHVRERESDKELLFINTHLDNISADARTKGVELILAFSQKFPDLPTVVVGDSNVSVCSSHMRWQEFDMRRPYELMREMFVDVWMATHVPNPWRPCTYHGFQGPDFGGDPYGTYDPEWIWVRGDISPVNCVLVRDAIGGVWPSDHYWMMAHLCW